MKTIKKSQPQIRKVRNKLNPDDIYFTYLGEIKEIDGVPFIAVFKNMSTNDRIHWMKRDIMEFVK
jgi:hypothetical protein